MVRLLTLLFALTFVTQANAQIKDPVKWSISSEKISDSEHLLSYTASIQEGWHIYSQQSSKQGPIPTTIFYETTRLVAKEIGEEFGHREEKLDPFFNKNAVTFSGKESYVITQRVTTWGGTSVVKGAIEYMACDDSRCLPPAIKDFEIALD